MKSSNLIAGFGRNAPVGHTPPVTPFQAFRAAVRLHQQGSLRDAGKLYNAQLKLTPHHFESLHYLGLLCMQRGDLEQARRLLRRALKCKPNSAEAYNSLANVMQTLRRYEEAIALFRKAIAINPGYAEAHNNLAGALQRTEHYEHAILEYNRALAAKPDFAEAHNNLAGLLLILNRSADAITSCDKALAIQPNYADAYFHKGVALEVIGRIDEARRSYKEAVENAPRNTRLYRHLAETHRFQRDDAYLARMEAIGREMPLLAPDEQMHLHFALGKAYMDLGQHDRAFHHLVDGNALKRRTVNYNEAVALQQLEGIRAVFTPELMATKEGLGEPSSVPVFVCGMPRSGTTLVEQILASHPKVFGAGELRNFDNALTECFSSRGKRASYPDGVTTLGAAELRFIGARYIETISAAAPSAEIITDKLPGNFRFIGLIHLALPNARIIHCRRDPLDTCLSCFSKLFSGDQSFSYDLAELGRYYRTYERLMDHWRQLLPEAAMLEVDYEAVVADLEGQARRIASYCGLEWDARCLAFHQTQRPVLTASAAQVRQPIYRSSVGRSHPYRHLLMPLLEALGTHAADGAAGASAR